MSADLCIEAIGFKATPRNQIDPAWARNALSQGRRAIKGINKAFLARVTEEPSNEYPNLAAYKRLLHGDLKAVELALFDAHREAAILPGGRGIVLLISGGISWGDSPTRLYESLCRLQEASILPDARWPRRKLAAHS